MHVIWWYVPWHRLSMHFFNFAFQIKKNILWHVMFFMCIICMCRMKLSSRDEIKLKFHINWIFHFVYFVLVHSLVLYAWYSFHVLITLQIIYMQYLCWFIMQNETDMVPSFQTNTASVLRTIHGVTGSWWTPDPLLDKAKGKSLQMEDWFVLHMESISP